MEMKFNEVRKEMAKLMILAATIGIASIISMTLYLWLELDAVLYKLFAIIYIVPLYTMVIIYIYSYFEVISEYIKKDIYNDNYKTFSEYIDANIKGYKAKSHKFIRVCFIPILNLVLFMSIVPKLLYSTIYKIIYKRVRNK